MHCRITKPVSFDFVTHGRELYGPQIHCLSYALVDDSVQTLSVSLYTFGLPSCRPTRISVLLRFEIEELLALIG